MSAQWSEECGRVRVEVLTIPMGNDLCVIITGGNRPHLGAVAVSQVRPSLDDPSQVSASTSVITLLGHKEDAIVQKAGQKLAAALNKNVVVCCGIHVDKITQDELQFIDEAVERFCKECVKQPR